MFQLLIFEKRRSTSLLSSLNFPNPKTIGLFFADNDDFMLGSVIPFQVLVDIYMVSAQKE